jgi:molybdate transport system ATP-binding protein
LIGEITGIQTDAGPLAAANIDLVGHGQLVALVTRKAVDELGIGNGDRVFALVKTVALDESTVAAIRS